MRKRCNNNQYFDSHMEKYAQSQILTQPKFYENSAMLINHALQGCHNVADIGNGGLIRLCKFGLVYQYSANSLSTLIRTNNLNIIATEPITMDKYIWIMGKKVLTFLPPCGAQWIEVRK